MKSFFKLYVICIVIGIVAFPVYAFASSNSGPAASGEGASTISGWVVSNLSYQLANDPSFVSGVSFDLDAAAGTVSVKLNSSGAVYTACTNTYGYHWQCDLSSGVKLSDMNEFHMIAAGN
ncbi:MAG TPA: hypothetical protein VF896_07370 [Anaerolineales bacterium]